VRGRSLAEGPPAHVEDAAPAYGFSLEVPLGVRFLIRSRILSQEEMAALSMP
jgi:hypothetical protein